MDDGRSIIAKLPHQNSGPATLTTSSEVATMDFARSVLRLPVPEVFDWSATRQNEVESEYILMEEAKGVQLSSIWDSLHIKRKAHVVKSIVDIEAKMMTASFDMIGSLYFCDSNIPGITAISKQLAPSDIDGAQLSRFSIGPIVRREFWAKERAAMSHHHGPWSSATDYLQSIGDREIEWLTKYAERHQSACPPWQHTSPQQLCTDSHISSLQKFKTVIAEIVPKDPDITRGWTWFP